VLKKRKIYEGHPKCASCGDYAEVRRLDNFGRPTYRPFCPSCRQQGLSELVKSGRCSNVSGHLGFFCPVNWQVAEFMSATLTDIDHIDGDNGNNIPSNLQELCPLCHREKSKRNGDHDGARHIRSAKAMISPYAKSLFTDLMES
jgi:hypothetical protein